MPNNAASSYANSIDSAGGIQQPVSSTTLKPVEVKADFNAGLPVTAEQLKAQTQTMPSEQVAKTNLGQNEGPKMTSPFGEAIKIGPHKDDMAKDGSRVVSHLDAQNKSSAKQKVQSKSVVSPETLKKLKNINAREMLKHQFTERVKEARAEQRQSLGHTQRQSM